jgi:predicted lipoprotein with Yx(FWY)xxD motif
MKPPRRIALAAATALTATAAISGCADIGGSDPYSDDIQPATVAPAHTDPGGRPAPTLTLSLARTKTLGWVVADGRGWILYRFDKDKGAPTPKSSCNGACAHKWPPVLWKGRPALKGISSVIVGKVKRADGSWQLTLHGWPVYRFAGDTRPGQWKGQGVGGTWHTILRNGTSNLAESATNPPTVDAEPTITDPYGNSSDY